MVVVRLGMTHEQAWRLSPGEVAEMMLGARLRRNNWLIFICWGLSLLLAPHVKKGKSALISPRALLLQAPLYDPDEEDLNRG